MRLSFKRLIPVSTAAVLASAMLVSVAASATTQYTGTAAPSGSKYVVMYKSNGVPANAAAGIAKAGGTLVASYGEIGVVVAESASPSFAAAAIVPVVWVPWPWWSSHAAGF